MSQNHLFHDTYTKRSKEYTGTVRPEETGTLNHLELVADQSAYIAFSEKSKALRRSWEEKEES